MMKWYYKSIALIHLMKNATTTTYYTYSELKLRVFEMVYMNVFTLDDFVFKMLTPNPRNEVERNNYQIVSICGAFV